MIRAVLIVLMLATSAWGQFMSSNARKILSIPVCSAAATPSDTNILQYSSAGGCWGLGAAGGGSMVYPGAGWPKSTGSAWDTSITPGTGVETFVATPSFTNLASAVTGDTVAGSASTNAFTNKSIDAEGTGNVITLPLLVNYRAAVCQNATASLGFSTPTSNPAVAACITGTNTQYAVAQFADGSNLSVQDHITLPSDFTGNIDVLGKWRTSATSGDVVFQVATICVADAETADPAFNTASTVTETAKGTTLQYNDFSISSVTITGCAAGEEMFVKFFRDSAHASDTLAATAELLSLSLRIRRAM